MNDGSAEWARARVRMDRAVKAASAAIRSRSAGLRAPEKFVAGARLCFSPHTISLWTLPVGPFAASAPHWQVGSVQPSALADEALARANQNAGHNTYLWQDAAWTRAEAARAEAMPRGEAARSAMAAERFGACLSQ
jgi:hypothetical protein